MDSKNRWLEKAILIIYFAGYLVLSMTMALNQPHIDHVSVQELSPPDEASRILVPMYICNHGTLPTGFEEEVRIAPYGFSYALYNVFPYIIQGYSMRIVSHFTDSYDALVIAGRMVNVLFGFLMSIVVYLFGKKAFSDQRFRWIFCFGVTYLPQALFIHTYINTDSMAMLSTAMIAYGLYSAYREEIRIRNCLWIAFGIIFCSLSYYNAYGYILCSIILFFGLYCKKENGKTVYQWKQMWPKFWLVTGIVFLGAGWWFIRSYIILDGDFLGLSTLTKMKDLYGDSSIASQSTYQSRGISILTMLRENQFFTCAYQSFIAAFGSLSILPYGFVYQFYKLFGGLGFLSWLISFFRDRELRRLSGKAILFHCNMVLCILIPVILLIRYAYTMDYQAQGRYLLPSLIPLMYYLAKGFEHVSISEGRGKRVLQKSMTAFSILVIAVMMLGSITTVFCKALPQYLALK